MFGVPFSEDAKKAYKDARLAGHHGIPKDALVAADSVLEVIASRASALAGAYGVLLAVVAIFQASTPSSSNWMLASMGGLVLALILLTPTLWLSFARDLSVYGNNGDELNRTYDLILFRAVCFNASILVAGTSFATGGIVYLVFR